MSKQPPDVEKTGGVGIRLDVDLYNVIQAEAAADDRSMARHINRVLRMHYSQKGLVEALPLAPQAKKAKARA